MEKTEIEIGSHNNQPYLLEQIKFTSQKNELMASEEKGFVNNNNNHDRGLKRKLSSDSTDMKLTDFDSDEIDYGCWKRKGGSSGGCITGINISTLTGSDSQTPSTSQSLSLNVIKSEASSSVTDDVAAECNDLSLSPIKPPESDDSDEEENIQEIRKRNIERMTALINSLRNPDLEMLFANGNKQRIKNMKRSNNKTTKKRDPTIRFKVEKPVEVRKSLRLQNKQPQYREADLDTIEDNLRGLHLKRSLCSVDENRIEDLEEVINSPKRKSRNFQRKEELRVIIPVEEVTMAMLNNIAVRVKGKEYSQSGTTCHQCRQKTLDQKTCCRSPDCVGIQGMFCGVCLENRYGENCAEALLNPQWICPVCRGKCNCSVCRNKQGKRPTGILAPLAKQQGYKCVDHFLEKLRGEGDKPEEDHIWALSRDSEALLGFSDGGRLAHFGNGKQDSMQCRLCAVTDCDNPDSLLGFSDDLKIAIMGQHNFEPLFGLEN